MLNIHRYWTGPNEPPLEPWLGNILRVLNPGVALKDWRDDNLPDDLKGMLHRSASQVRPMDELIHRGNIVRLYMLLNDGGWWYDHDVIPLLPVMSLGFNVIASHNGLCNSFMGFEAGDYRIEGALDAVLAAEDSNRPAQIVSGSTFLRQYLSDALTLEYPYSPDGQILHGERPFAVHLSLTNGSIGER